ncbi:MAG TPA: hypothetical protein VK539_36865 [Myxococcaceae bacterium]|nr:hypothetical protein [Myxococcaceae bacterium]
MSASIRGTQRRVAGHVGSLLFHVVYVTPIFWFVELLQNQLYWKLTGAPGWTYPRSPYHWFSFESLGLWGGSVVLIWCLHFFWFQRRGVGMVKRMIIAGTLCWAGEWLSGFVADQVFHRPLQIWTNAPLVYVQFSALFFWWWDVLLYQLLTVDIASLGRAAPPAPESGSST